MDTYQEDLPEWLGIYLRIREAMRKKKGSATGVEVPNNHDAG
jgi:hypothetical protein